MTTFLRSTDVEIEVAEHAVVVVVNARIAVQELEAGGVLRAVVQIHRIDVAGDAQAGEQPAVAASCKVSTLSEMLAI